MWLTRKLASLASFDRKLKRPGAKSIEETKRKQQQQRSKKKSRTNSEPLNTSSRPIHPSRGQQQDARSTKSAIKCGATVKSMSIMDPTTKPLPPILSSSAQIKTCDKTLVIVVAGALNVGKSTLIRAAQNLLLERQCHSTTFVLDDVQYPLRVIEIDDAVINMEEDPPEFPEDLATVHGGLICYDTTNCDSMDCLPDLLNAYVSRNIPSYLIGLKADLSSLRQVDSELGRTLGNFFGVELFEVDAFSEDGTKRMKEIYTMLVKRCIEGHSEEFRSFSPSSNTNNSSISSSNSNLANTSGDESSQHADGKKHISETEELVRRSSISSNTSYSSDYRFPSLSSKKAAATTAISTEGVRPLTGFVYAPTVSSSAPRDKTTPEKYETCTTHATIGKEHSTTKANLYPIQRTSSLPNHRYVKTGLASGRRGSRDSCESFGIGLAVEDIIDKLLMPEPSRPDEHILIVFITFFRRFMKPRDLVEILIERFESDSLLEPPPTRLQERVQEVFTVWMNNYWNDFSCKKTRKILVAFLERIAKEERLRPIADSLIPLTRRIPPTEDPDAQWGLVDSDTENSDDSDDNDDLFYECEPPSTPIKATGETVKRKKDSGYSARSFSACGFFGTYEQDDNKSISEGYSSAPPTPGYPEPPTLKRISSTSSFSLFRRPRRSSISSSANFLFSRYPITAAKQQTEPEEPSVSDGQYSQKSDDNPQPPPVSSGTAEVGSVTGPRSTSRQSIDTAAPQKEGSSNTTSGVTSPGRRIEFAGGLINLDLYCGMSASPSWTSFGTNNTLTSSTASFMSAFGSSQPGNKFEKDQHNNNFRIMMDIPDRVIAEQLTWIEAELFGKVKTREFVRNIWTSRSSFSSSRPNSISLEDPGKAMSAVAASIAHFNFISAWVATMIVTQAKLNKRAALLEKFMTIAVELRNYNNYNSLMAVLAGLNSASVLRLKQAREAVSEKKIYKQFQSLERLMSSDRSFSSYRLALKASEPPGIPYLGIHNQDLVSLAEANKDFRSDGTIHWEKFRLMGECIVAVTKFQWPKYNIEPDGRILRFIAETGILSEDEQYRRSHLVEPRLKSSSTNRLRDLWLRVQ